MPLYHVHRSTEIDAPPQKVFEVVSDFGTWTTWSPWLCAEPDAQVNVTDDASSVGSIYSWKGEIIGEAQSNIISYEHLGNAWSAANQFARYKKLRQCKVGTYEIYLNDPKETSPSELRTEIFLPLKS